ncbi:peptidoglycan-N-acetylmuramic acid deacetylase [Hydrogenoanaerobacterium saccharovorans]|uniref:Peptidoglycan-N-acetylmuramic acid deacetylase n=1 Tax=Hydrogenoanaerobacterium saccharovorans TaxID=474960 RepID=A0A1H8BKE5_9FIRM|nr:polysaccharide deacetylase family protein [Hydrogenoanaerobacterium saccharovorans]RPF47399.1 peptidoglycan-N-acetylmuramic acid deacetylase [Hydrogenoanaerobacterium saccharovorans]SEM82357.1 peptidoglycan-N-acetylmuramic acid deacetylase [Hydrogenoanaerobacterium saccharovorans]
MKFLKTALILAAMTAMVTLSGCTACNNLKGTTTSSVPPVTSSVPPATSSAPAITSSEGSVLPSEPKTSSSTPSPSGTMVPTLSTDFSEIGALDGKQVTWGPGRQKDEVNRPTACLQLQKKYGKYNAYFIGSEKGKLYLTFDEGYENGYTSKILDVLKDKKVPAVFFVTMHYVKTNPELIQRMIDEGHVVGNHSDKHPNFTTLPLDAAQTDIMSLHNYMKDNYNYNMSLFRYPEGAFSEQTLALVNKIGYKQLFWSFAYNDWNPDKQPPVEDATNRMVDAAHDGAIYLLHAVSSANTAALPKAIDTLRNQGYEFVLFNEDSPTTIS